MVAEATKTLRKLGKGAGGLKLGSPGITVDKGRHHSQQKKVKVVRFSEQR